MSNSLYFGVVKFSNKKFKNKKLLAFLCTHGTLTLIPNFTTPYILFYLYCAKSHKQIFYKIQLLLFVLFQIGLEKNTGHEGLYRVNCVHFSQKNISTNFKSLTHVIYSFKSTRTVSVRTRQRWTLDTIYRPDTKS